MKTITCSNGVKLTYDDTLVVGDLVAGYKKGYFEIIEITPRNGHPPLFTLTSRYKADGTPVKNTKLCTCDASYSKRASVSIKQEIKNFKIL